MAQSHERSSSTKSNSSRGKAKIAEMIPKEEGGGPYNRPPSGTCVGSSGEMISSQDNYPAIIPIDKPLASQINARSLPERRVPQPRECKCSGRSKLIIVRDTSCPGKAVDIEVP
jgi:hypothetical protein